MTFVSADKDVREKVGRLGRGGRPRVLDLFSGCGGLSLGFHRAGFEIAGAVEMDPQAAASHGRNFHPGDARYGAARDILQLAPEQLAASLDLGPPGLAFDVLVGGPPCQAFARVGRSKLREIDAHPEAFRHDPRARLYLEYLRYVRVLKPLALLMENVPDVLNHGGQNIAEETCDVLEQYGYVARYTLLNAALYGVPQMRERMILVAYRRELASAVIFPRPDHWIDLPQGYRGSRNVALKLVKSGAGRRYVAPPSPIEGANCAVSARAALADLPAITTHLRGESRRGMRRLETEVAYRNVGASDYATIMRGWKDFETDGRVTAHVTRHLPRDWKIFERMRAGDQYPEAHKLAMRMFEARLAELGAAEPHLTSEAYTAMKAQYVPPYDPTKFPNKWRKMEPDLPARTLMAHLGKDSYSHIHYDSSQARTISVREAARLQSFPDGFAFEGAMNAAFRQIGNAVPPLLAAAVAGTIRETLRQASAEPVREPLRAVAG